MSSGSSEGAAQVQESDEGQAGDVHSDSLAAQTDQDTPVTRIDDILSEVSCSDGTQPASLPDRTVWDADQLKESGSGASMYPEEDESDSDSSEKGGNLDPLSSDEEVEICSAGGQSSLRWSASGPASCQQNFGVSLRLQPNLVATQTSSSSPSVSPADDEDLLKGFNPSSESGTGLTQQNHDHVSSSPDPTRGLKLPDRTGCPLWSSSSKLHTCAPKLKGLSIKSRNVVQEQPPQKPEAQNASDASDRPTRPPPAAVCGSEISSLPDWTACRALSQGGDRRRPGRHAASDPDVRLGPQAARQPSTQRTFIQVRLSSSTDPAPPVETVPMQDVRPPGRDQAAPGVSPAASTAEQTNGVAGFSNSFKDLKAGPVESGTPRLHTRTVERRSFSSDYSPFSVRHKIKSFENLANVDKPAAKTGEVQSFALTYSASLSQRVAGFTGLVPRQRSSYVETVGPPFSALGKPPGVSLINLEVAPSSCSAADVLNVTPHTPPVLRRRLGKLPRSRVRQLRALSMPELEKLCTEDYTASDKTETSVHPTAPEGPPPSAGPSERDPGSTDARQEASDTRGNPPGWSIRWGTKCLPEASSS